MLRSIGVTAAAAGVPPLLRSENARQGANTPSSTTTPGSSSVRKAGNSAAARSIAAPPHGHVRIADQWCGFVALRIRGSAVHVSVGIGHAGRQPGRSGLARRPVETDAGGAFRGIEGGFERRGEFRLLVAGVVSCPAIAEDLPADREAVRLLHPAPVIGSGRPPVIGERDREPPTGGFDDRVGPVLDRQLWLEAKGDAPGEEPLFDLRRQRRERREAFRRRQFEPVEIESAALRFEQVIGRGAGEIVQ